MRRTLTCLLSLAAAAAFTVPALAAAPADDLLGTWECYVPGGPPTKTPPIVWFGPTAASGAAAGTTVDLDGFARTVSGISEVVSEAGGWWKVQPQDGESFLVQSLPPRGGKTPQMTLRRGAASYNCLRLPKYS
jgi:hypothetical protein